MVHRREMRGSLAPASPAVINAEHQHALGHRAAPEPGRARSAPSPRRPALGLVRFLFSFSLREGFTGVSRGRHAPPPTAGSLGGQRGGPGAASRRGRTESPAAPAGESAFPGINRSREPFPPRLPALLGSLGCGAPGGSRPRRRRSRCEARASSRPNAAFHRSPARVGAGRVCRRGLYCPLA